MSRPGPIGRPLSHWQAVADTYLAGGYTPTLAVANQFSVNHTTAAKWVSRARHKGLLPVTTPGKSTNGGGISSEKLCKVAEACEISPAVLRAAILEHASGDLRIVRPDTP